MLTSIGRISLLATCICCHFAISASHSDCGQLEQCVTDPHGDIWCSLYNNVSTKNLAILKTLIINESISSATVDDTNVKIYWNTHTQDIFLNVKNMTSNNNDSINSITLVQISGDYQRAGSLDIRALLEGNNLPVHVHVELYSK